MARVTPYLLLAAQYLFPMRHLLGGNRRLLTSKKLGQNLPLC